MSGGTFRAQVALEPGANVIDVIATARGRGAGDDGVPRDARDAGRRCPTSTGSRSQEVEERLVRRRAAAPTSPSAADLIEELLPGEPAVCEQDPEPGTEVRRGTTVRVEVAKSC